MITIIFGEPGAGKTSLSAYFLKRLYRTEGDRLRDLCCERIAEDNVGRAVPLSLPLKPPIFSDYGMKILADYEEEYEPYFINGYYFGLSNENIPTQYVPPCSKVFLSEGQRYFDARKSATFPVWVSRAFEMHRHFGCDIWIDVQREQLIDLNIRTLCKRFIEVRKMEADETENGRITNTKWYCREFTDFVTVERYVEEGIGAFKETTYENRGNIFRCFDSKNRYADFLPKNGKDYVYLPHANGEAQKSVPDDLKMFYSFAEPKGFRGKSSGGNKDNKGEKAA